MHRVVKFSWKIATLSQTRYTRKRAWWIDLKPIAREEKCMDQRFEYFPGLFPLLPNYSHLPGAFVACCEATYVGRSLENYSVQRGRATFSVKISSLMHVPHHSVDMLRGYFVNLLGTVISHKLLSIRVPSLGDFFIRNESHICFKILSRFALICSCYSLIILKSKQIRNFWHTQTRARHGKICRTSERQPTSFKSEP